MKKILILIALLLGILVLAGFAANLADFAVTSAKGEEVSLLLEPENVRRVKPPEIVLNPAPNFDAGDKGFRAAALLLGLVSDPWS